MKQQMSGSPDNNILIAFDLGNSRIKCGLFIDDISHNKNRLPACSLKLIIGNDEPFIWDDLLKNVDKKHWSSIRSVIAGARSTGAEIIKENWLHGVPQPQIIHQPELLPIVNNTDKPENVGIDRLLNGVAVNHIRPAKSPAIIIDSGTATTVDLISPEGAFEGGAILPGFELSAFSLHQYTELLPLLTVKRLTSQKCQPYGHNTFDALQSGILWGQVGAVKELILQLQSTLNHEASIYLTGGGADLLRPHLSGIQHLPDLSLQGLALLAHSQN